MDNDTPESWMTRNARPFTVFFLLGLLSYLVVIAPALGMVDDTIRALSAVPESLWNLITVGIGGYALMRAGEKIAGAIRKGDNERPRE